MQRTATLSPEHDIEVDATVSGAEMLRTAVERITVEGWESTWAAWLFAQLETRCPAWAAKIDHRCNRRPGTLAPEDVLSACWSTISRFPEGIVAAKAPWAYLWTAVRNDLAVEITAESMLSTRGARRPHAERPARLVRVGTTCRRQRHRSKPTISVSGGA